MSNKMIGRIVQLILVLLLTSFSGTLWSYSYDAHLPVSNQVNLAFESQNQHYDGAPNLCYRCVNPSVENLQKKALDGSFFAFEVGFIATKGGSKKVQDVMDAIKQNDVKVKVNPRNQATKQEGNVTLDFGDGTKANLRVETHPLSQNGTPIRHGNVEVTKQVKNRNKVIKNTHITDD